MPKSFYLMKVSVPLTLVSFEKSFVLTLMRSGVLQLKVNEIVRFHIFKVVKFVYFKQLLKDKLCFK